MQMVKHNLFMEIQNRQRPRVM